MSDAIDLNRRWVNYGTGEIKDGVRKLETDDDVARRQQQHKGYQYYKNNLQPLPWLLKEEYGSYIHTRYKALLEKIGYDAATAFRFIYLCTFMDYDNGYIMWKNNKVTDKMLKDIFDVSRNTIPNIKKALYSNELIYADADGYIYANTDYCYRGDIKNNPEYKRQCTRIFNDGIQDLYKKSDNPLEHKTLGKFMLLLPYINIYHNILCLNPREKEISKLVLPSPEMLDSILKCGERNSKKVIQTLFDITVGGERAILMVTDTRSVRMYVVNPRIYYGGTNINNLEETMGYFKVKGGIAKGEN